MKKADETKGIFNKLPVSAAKFIKQVIKKMRYRREVRQDVQAELTAHFEDELKDCKRNSEGEQKARQLIGDFGDARLLAVLLRRAKKRCRPLWRTAVAITFQTTGIITLCFIVYVIWFMSGKPVITTDYVAELNRIVQASSDGTLNAAPFYHKAAQVFKELPDDISVLFRKKYKEVTPEQKQVMEKWLTDNQETLELVISGTQRLYYCRTYGNKQNTSEMISILLPDLNEFRNLVRALTWRARLRAEQGRYEDAFDDIKSCYRFGRHLRGDKSLIEQLVGIAIEALAAQTIRDILSEHRIDSPVLAELQQGFENMIADEDCTVSFKFEKLSIYDEIQRSFTDGLRGGHIIPKHIAKLLPEVQIISALSTGSGRVPTPRKQKVNWLSERISDIRDVVEDVGYQSKIIAAWAKKGGYVLFFHPDKYETREMVDGLYDYWEQTARKSPAQIRAENIDIEKQAMEIVEGNILLEIFTPAIGRVCEIAHRNRIDVEATLAVIAILRYKQDTGNYPENLDELIEAGLLKALSIDPYSDQSLVYKRTESDFALYGVGENFKDDGGTVAVVDGRLRKWGTKEEGDWVFWPVSK
ncbi:MAG: hypothetical protein FVQ85_02555 [Planctomycetes bacterium]|nr:hypothetical protein [Planctomycetota bacterium]